MQPRKVALVTGAGGGIGGAVARRLGSEGYLVAGADRDAAALARSLGDLQGGASFTCDVRSASEVEQLRDAVLAWEGPPELLVNAAGVFTLCRVPEMSEDTFDEVLGVNLKGTFLLCRAFLPSMIERHSGSIVNISSTSGLEAARDRAAYAASKAGVILFTRSLARDHGPDGVRVNCVCPGLVDTTMASWVTKDEAGLAAFLELVPAGRVGSVEDIASAVSFLASDQADYVHGATLVVDGGRTV